MLFDGGEREYSAGAPELLFAGGQMPRRSASTADNIGCWRQRTLLSVVPASIVDHRRPYSKTYSISTKSLKQYAVADSIKRWTVPLSTLASEAVCEYPRVIENAGTCLLASLCVIRGGWRTGWMGLLGSGPAAFSCHVFGRSCAEEGRCRERATHGK